MRDRERGLTLTELCIVLAMTSVVVSFVGPPLLKTQGRAYDAAAQGCAHNYQYALQLRQVDLHSFRLPVNDREALIRLEGVIPTCADPHLLITGVLSTDVTYRLIIGDERGLSAFLVTPGDIERQELP